MDNFHDKLYSVIYSWRGNISPRFSCHSEASASEWHENLKEMFLLYYMESDVTNKFNFSTTYKYVTYGENDAPSSIFKIHFSTKSQSSSNHTVYCCWMVSLVYSKVTNATHKKMQHGTLPMYHGTLPMYHGTLSMYHGTSAVYHGTFSYGYLC